MDNKSIEVSIVDNTPKQTPNSRGNQTASAGIVDNITTKQSEEMAYDSFSQTLQSNQVASVQDTAGALNISSLENTDNEDDGNDVKRIFENVKLNK